MGISRLFCCFKGMNPVCPAVTGLIVCIISFGFYLWDIVIDMFFGKNASNVLLNINFIITIVLFILFIIVLAIAIIKKPSCGPVGKIICIIIIALCIISWILTLIFFIITIKDYADIEKQPRDPVDGGDWAAFLIPCIFSLLGLILMALCANYLCSTFAELGTTASFPVNQITESNNYPNVGQPGIFPNNSPGLAVNIQQSEVNK